MVTTKYIAIDEIRSTTPSTTRTPNLLENVTDIATNQAHETNHAHIGREKAFFTPCWHRRSNGRSRHQMPRQRPLTPIPALAGPCAVAGTCCPAAPTRRRPRHHGGPSPMNATPRRIKLRRTAGWRKPADAVVVARPTRWGNPVRVGEPVQLTTQAGDVAIITTTPTVAVEFYRDIMRTRLTRVPGEHPDDAAWVEQWRTWVAQLRGHDLACWCPLDQACHGDVLLELANGRLP